MDLQQLKAVGGVISTPLVKKKIEWQRPGEDPEKPDIVKFDVWIRRHTFDVMEAMFAAGESKASHNARYLSASVMLGKDGTEALPVEEVRNLDASLGLVLMDAVNEVNNPPAKKSPRKRSSGTSSSSTASAVEASQKPKPL